MPASSSNDQRPCVITIFGASGDLTRRKLVPALYHLVKEKLLERPYIIVGSARTPKSDDEFRGELKEALAKYSRSGEIDDELWESFAPKIHYHSADVTKADQVCELEKALQGFEKDIAGEVGKAIRLYYFATAPDRVTPAMDSMAEGGLIPNKGEPDENDRYRIVVEKPFGHDLGSARELNRALKEHFPEQDIYRIDHYLGKETVQNLLYFRFANSIWEPLWNRQHVDSVQITVAEDIGVGSRGGYYDESGAARDMLQNHLMQIMSLVAMEPPGELVARDINDEKVKVLHAMLPPQPDLVCPMVVRGQYGPGTIKGQPTPGYRGEDKVPSGSMTETYVAIKLSIDNWRWSGVPFYLRTGKALKKKVTTIAVIFKRPPTTLFEKQHFAGNLHLHRNVLFYRIQPNEAYALETNVKLPGKDEVDSAHMTFPYSTKFKSGSPEAYERLLLDAIRGDTSLFIRDDQTETAWQLIDSVHKCWADDDKIPIYEPGTWGPKEADMLLQRDGNHWRVDDFVDEATWPSA